MKKLQNIAILLCMIIASGYANSKDSSYVKGVIVTSENKIDCFVKSKGSYSGKIKYKLDYSSWKKEKIHSNDVVQIICSNKLFDKIQIGDKNHLLQRLCKGKISLYKREKEEENAPMYNAATGTTMSIGSQTKHIYYIVVDGRIIKIDRKTYKDHIPALFKSNQELKEKAQNLKPRDKDFIKRLSSIIDKYNKEV